MVRPLSLASAFMFACLPSWALYKVVGPDGSISYTDRPPVDAKQSQPLTTGSASGNSSPSLSGLPYELQKVVSRYPVVLITSSDCGPCDSGRQYLMRRGIPFSEKTVSTAEDIRAYKKATGWEQLPTLKIGSQQLQGYSENEWNDYLTAAGYPAQSMLPSGYKLAAPSPLAPPAATAEKPESRREGSKAPATPSPAAPNAPAGNAPPGFRF